MPAPGRGSRLPRGHALGLLQQLVRSSPSRRAWPFAALVVVALLVWAPTLTIAHVGQSYDYNLSWSAQFSRAFEQGDLYPRWTAGSFEGLGSPTFYFYPPLAFWVAGLIGVVTGAITSADLQLKLAELVFFAASGWSMFLWLRFHTSTGRALVGALVFVMAPYHVYDHYLRGDLTEFSAIAFIPLVALGLAATARGDRLAPILLAGSWAALIFAHLPMALLTAVFLIAPYGALLLLGARDGRPARLARWAGALAAGTGLAAVYLAPALGLQGFISAEFWRGAGFQASRHLFSNPAVWRTSPLESFLAVISLVEALVAAAAGWLAWRAGDRRSLFWAGLAVAVFLMTAGVAPAFWSLPILSEVQFPWRAMALQDFALVTLLAAAPAGARMSLPYVAFALLAVANLYVVGRDFTAGPRVVQTSPWLASFPADTDPPEYLPHGMLRMTRDGPAPAVPGLSALPLVAGAVGARSDPVTGAIWLRRPVGAAGPVTARRFYFPSWQARCDGRDVAVAPVGAARLVGFTPPPGARSCRAFVGRTAEERLGGAIALTSLALLCLYALWAGGLLAGLSPRRYPRPGADDPAPVAGAARPIR